MPEIGGLRLAVVFSRISIEDCRSGSDVKVTAFEIFGAILTLSRDGRSAVMRSLILRIVHSFDIAGVCTYVYVRAMGGI